MTPGSQKPTASGGAATGPVDVSVLVPVLNEAETVEELSRRVADVLDRLGRSFEIIFRTLPRRRRQSIIEPSM